MTDLITDAKDRILMYPDGLVRGQADIRQLVASLRAALTRAESAEGKLCAAREALKECQYVIHELLCAGNEDVDGNKAGCFKGCKMAKDALSPSSPCRHAAIAERVEDTEGIARFLYESQVGKNWYDLSDKGKELWREEAIAVQKFLRGEG